MFSMKPSPDLFGVEPAMAYLPPKGCSAAEYKAHREERSRRCKLLNARAKDHGVKREDLANEAAANEAMAKLQPYVDFPLKTYKYSYL